MIAFRETQRFRQWWIWAVILAIAGFAWYGFVQQIIYGKPFGTNPASDLEMWVMWIVLGIILPVSFYYLRLIVEVRTDSIRIRLFPVYSRTIPWDRVKGFEAVEYRPFWDYGGRGIRWSPGKGWLYNVSGNKGVRLTLANGKQLVIGSQAPEALAQAIGEAARTAR